jgi:acetyl/propionyl-CoA carboxylase alpha subunit
MSLKLTIDQETVRVDIVGRVPALRLRIDGREHDVVVDAASDGAFSLVIDGRRHEGFRHLTNDQVWIRLAGRTFVLGRANVAAAGAQRGTGRDEIRAEMPGTVVATHVREGQRVSAGDPVLTLESMKLQLTIVADHDATITSILVRDNATFERGAVLVVLGAPEATTPETT